MPASLLLIGLLILAIFLWYEIRRFRFYDLYRARVRFFQENVFADALAPSGVEHPRWREELSDDLRRPTFKLTAWEALSRRLRRIYGLLFVVVGVGWVAKVTLFTPETQWTEAAGLPGVHGIVVATLLGAFYFGMLAVEVWPPTSQREGRNLRRGTGCVEGGLRRRLRGSEHRSGHRLGTVSAVRPPASIRRFGPTDPWRSTRISTRYVIFP